MKRSVGAIVLSVVLAITMATVAVPGTAGASTPARGGPAAPPVPTIAWASCKHPGVPQAECATATVPLDYDDPTGATTGIALARIPATDAANRVGTLFVNPGGPGVSGVGYVLGGTGEYLHDRLGGRFDVVGFDPRGVARSDPLSCFSSNAERNAFLLHFLDSRTWTASTGPSSTTGSSTRPSVSDRMIPIAAAHEHRRRRPRPGRAAAGGRRPQLTYLGLSYGSYIGTTYANLFEDNIRSMALDGVLDPILGPPAYRSLRPRRHPARCSRFLRLCDEAGSACAFDTAEGAKARWERLTAAKAGRRAPARHLHGTTWFS